jgi:glycosyltransferase involved in cell wall biosynthesis
MNRDNVKFDVVAPPEIAKEYDFASNVDWHSGLSTQELLALYRGADILLMTALDATANNALLEGMACGLPVVCQKVGGLTAYVNDSCALFAPPRDAESLVEQLRRLGQDLGLRKRLSDGARALAMNYEWSVVASKTRHVYQEAITDLHKRTR